MRELAPSFVMIVCDESKAGANSRTPRLRFVLRSNGVGEEAYFKNDSTSYLEGCSKLQHSKDIMFCENMVLMM